MQQVVKIDNAALPDLPKELDGSLGINRATGSTILAASDDRSAILAWLARTADSPNTLSSYKKEADRLYRWSVITLGKPISSLTHEDMLRYQRFLENPQPREAWVSDGRFGRKHPKWRPFAGPLSRISINQAMVTLNAMFAWLVDAGYLAANPLRLRRRPRTHGDVRVSRLLAPVQWEAVLDHIAEMPKDSHRDLQHYHRCRWMFSLFFLTGMRISEVCNTAMGAFYSRRSMDGQVQWWVEIIGKGRKVRQVPAPDDLVRELRIYRESMVLPPLPSPGESLPLVLAVNAARRTAPLTRFALHAIAKSVFLKAADRLRSAGETDSAIHLEKASAHWLRHTAGSRMADAGVDIRTIQANYGHESLDTTSVYVREDDDRRHRDSGQHRLDSRNCSPAGGDADGEYLPGLNRSPPSTKPKSS